MSNCLKLSAMLICVWAFAPAPALAFQEVPAAPPPAGAAPSGALDLATPATPDPAPSEKEGGFRVPGLGSFALPKLNFGLELLYGAPGTDAAPLSIGPDIGTGGPGQPADDLTIRGTVKRRF